MYFTGRSTVHCQEPGVILKYKLIIVKGKSLHTVNNNLKNRTQAFELGVRSKLEGLSGDY